MKQAKKRVGVLISGRGSNLQALIDAQSAPDYPAQIVRVISNIPDVFGLERAQKAGLPTAVIPHKNYPDRPSFEAALNAQLKADGVEIVCLAGFMRVLTDGFVSSWSGRLINIHPSLLPSFKGLHTHERAIAEGVRFSGCTVHFVVPEMDSGPIIVQSAVPVLQEDTPDKLASRVLEQEHLIYPLALALVATDRARIVDSVVQLNDVTFANQSLTNPLPRGA
ncbi:MAG: phosphoribosylglycinamide formyltransferase [Alphaproteobacteria bacterium]|nr:phosphoribosylglycinamide formyltransferase [Alphaproteobacteria bacterium]